MHKLSWILAVLPVFIALYAYVAYPLVLLIISRVAPRKWVTSSQYEPLVSVVVPAYNEERQIAGAIDAVLAQDYPREKMQILILSDASTDRTDDIVAAYASRGVEFMRMPERGGKTKAENAAVPRLRGEIIVNTDASIRLHPGAVRALVRCMADPIVGVASGRDISVPPSGTTVNLTESGYVNYEMWVRSLESRTGGIVGASGSCYAIRADLHALQIPDDLSRDFCAVLTARHNGYRSVSVDDAVCLVPSTPSLDGEYQRKVRTISRGMDTLYFRRQLLDPIRDDLFAWKLFSHKLCRWGLPVAIIPGLIGLTLLARDHRWALWTLGATGLAGLIALSGALWPANRPMPRLLALAAFGAAANLAVINAIWRVARGHEDHMWEPTRRSA